MRRYWETLRERFAGNKAAFAAAWNEILTAHRYPAYREAIYASGHNLLSWAIRRGAIWAS